MTWRGNLYLNQWLTLKPRKRFKQKSRFGSYPKTASSSIEANVAENLLKEIDIDSIVGEYGSSSSSSSSSAKASLASESPAAAPKRKLKIVRRISAPVDENAEEAKDETEASEETKEVEFYLDKQAFWIGLAQ